MAGKGNLICEPLVRWNLICMIWMWSAMTLSLYVMNFFLKYVEGSVFVNFSMAGGAEVLANAFVGVVFPHTGVKYSFFIGYCIAFSGGICLVFMDSFKDSSTLIALFVLLAKFGVAMA
jgi:hypothetical protein